MNKLHRQRLLKLANHLLKGKLGHDVFNFTCYNANIDSSPLAKRRECGSCGCAIGEMPIVWPKFWGFDYHVVVNKKIKVFRWEHQKEWFGITYTDYDFLFCPVSHYFGVFVQTSVGTRRRLTRSATKEQVAKNIIKFVKDYEKKEKCK